MKILWLSPEDNGVTLAYRVQFEGHDVRYFGGKDGNMVGILKDLRVFASGDWKNHVSWADLIVCDDVDVDNDFLYKTGKMVVGGNELFNKLENDRLFGKKTFKQIGLDISDMARFYGTHPFDDAIAFVKKNPARWVFKPDGQAERTLNYVSEEDTGSDMIERLEFYKDNSGKKMKKSWDKDLGVQFVLERCVDGIEVACGAYWDGARFSGININFEHKKHGCGDVGITTGEMGTVVHLLSKDTKLFARTLAKLSPLLSKTQYHSYVDLNCIVSDKKAYVLEITSRLGHPIESLLDALRWVPTGQWLKALATGTTSDKMFRDDWGIVFIVGTFGWPYPNAFELLGSDQPFRIPKDGKGKIYLVDATYHDGKLYTPPKGPGQIMTVTGTDKDLKSAKKKALDIIDKISLVGKDYRLDIGDKVPENMKKLSAMGWI